jgi:tRNA-2-methylthio-N6-dimethylallyladenosine synthase
MSGIEGNNLSERHNSGERLFVKTFGCQMNEWDSIKVAQLLSERYALCESEADADLIFINTCSVREKGEHKLRSYLGTLREFKLKNPGLIIGIGGCVAQQEGRTLARQHREVDFVVGTHNLSLVPSLINSVKQGNSKQVAVDFREEWEDFTSVDQLGSPNFLVGESPVKALVAIQRGCNKRCSFCVVPTTRGPEVSRVPAEIIREVTASTKRGAVEVLLLGQTVNSYGKDLSPRYPFERLIEDIAKIDGVKRIRFTSPHPAEVKDSFIELYGRVEKLVPHIHLPLQSGNNRILKAMNRNYKRERYLEIVARLRDRVPDLAITTDIIVGFPTETEDEFQDTLSIVNEVRFQSAFSFIYSSRPNTVARDAFGRADDVPSDQVARRMRELIKLQTDISGQLNARLLGSNVQVLIESPRFGRTESGVPVEILTARFAAGDIVSLRVTATSPHGLKAGDLIAC